MRRAVLAIVIIVAVMSPARKSQAAGAGISANMGEEKLSLSTGISYINKDIKNNGQKDAMTARQLEIKGAYSFKPNLDINLKIGFADLEVSNFAGRLGALYGAGLRFNLFKDTENRVKVLLDGEVTKFSSNDINTTADVMDYKAAIIFNNKSGNTIPYGGVKASQTEVSLGGSSGKSTSDKNLGVFGGMDYFVNPNVFFSGEVNIFDQQALHVGVGYKF